MTDEDYIGADDWIPVMLEFVNDGKLFKLSPKGISMYPLIVGKRDFEEDRVSIEAWRYMSLS